MSDSTATSRFSALADVLFAHDGRIGRLHYWLGLIAASGITGFFAGIADGVVTGTGEMGRYLAFAFIVALFIWMHSALTIKRLHDRDRAGLWYFLYGIGPPGLLLWAISLHIDNKPTTASLLYVLSAAGLLWVFIELGLMRGSLGANRYGSDNL